MNPLSSKPLPFLEDLPDFPKKVLKDSMKRRKIRKNRLLPQKLESINTCRNKKKLSSMKVPKRNKRRPTKTILSQNSLFNNSLPSKKKIVLEITNRGLFCSRKSLRTVMIHRTWFKIQILNNFGCFKYLKHFGAFRVCSLRNSTFFNKKP